MDSNLNYLFPHIFRAIFILIINANPIRKLISIANLKNKKKKSEEIYIYIYIYFNNIFLKQTIRITITMLFCLSTLCIINEIQLYG